MGVVVSTALRESFVLKLIAGDHGEKRLGQVVVDVGIDLQQLPGAPAGYPGPRRPRMQPATSLASGLVGSGFHEEAKFLPRLAGTKYGEGVADLQCYLSPRDQH